MRRLVLLTAALVLMVGPGAALAAAAPALQVLSPGDGARITGDAVTVAFQVADFRIVPTSVPVSELGKRPDANRPGEGHLHLMLDLTPLVVWERGEPYTFTGVPAGDHRLVVELVNNDHSSLTPPVLRELRFQTAPMVPRTGAGGGPAARHVVLGLGGLAWLAVVAGLGHARLRRQHGRGAPRL